MPAPAQDVKWCHRPLNLPVSLRTALEMAFLIFFLRRKTCFVFVGKEGHKLFRASTP